MTSEGVYPFQPRNTIGWAMGGETERATDIIGRRDAIASDELWTSSDALRLEQTSLERRRAGEEQRETIAREPSGPRALEQVEEEGDSWTTRTPMSPADS